jgi:hypothetical protein
MVAEQTAKIGNEKGETSRVTAGKLLFMNSLDIRRPQF